MAFISQTYSFFHVAEWAPLSNDGRKFHVTDAVSAEIEAERELPKPIHTILNTFIYTNVPEEITKRKCIIV